MDRKACVDVPALPLQVLLKNRPEWVDRPVAVVDRDRPQGVLLWVNGRARERRVLPGMRYAAALALASDLRAAAVSAEEVREHLVLLSGRLRRFSAEVEPAADAPGVFWLGAEGLGRLHGSLPVWARRVRSGVGRLGFRCRVAVGFSKFGVYAAARSGLGGGNVVFRDAGEERTAVGSIALGDLGLTPALRDALERLGVRTLAAFLELPPEGVGRRLGAEARRLHALALGTGWNPLCPVPEEEPLARETDLEEPETDTYRLLFRIKGLLDPLLAALAERRSALTELQLRLHLDGPLGQSAERVERIRPAAPTLDARQVLNLAHLRLEALELAGGVTAVAVTVRAVPVTARQIALFAERPRRDPEAAERALARLRAEFGAAAVVRARLQEGHLPEARFAWEPLERLAHAQPRDVPGRPLVRRIFARPVPLPPRSRSEPDGWLLKGEEYGHVVECVGPYLVSGGWWRREVRREYFFAQVREGDLLWIYYDRQRRAWFWQGEVE